MSKSKAPEGLSLPTGSASSADPVSSHDISLGSAPTAAEAEKAVVKAETSRAKKVEPPKPQQSVVPYRVFAALSGMKPSSLAGFNSYVKREEMKPVTVAEWHTRYKAFMAKPVKSL